MRKLKTKISMLLIISLVVCSGLFSTTKINATSNLENAPTDWAFEASSIELNNAIVEKYPMLDDGNGFVTKAAANARTGSLQIVGENIAGTIKGIENFTAISELYLQNNQLSGEIPSGLGDLSNLIFLKIDNNQLSGEIPSSLGKLNQLSHLDLQNNQLNGNIPSSLGELDNLKELNLSMNQLSGEIPSSLGKLSNLTDLILSDNQLSGEIPSSLGELNSLEVLQLINNQLSGEIPSSLGDLSNLWFAYLNNNQLSGEIPSSLGKLSNLNGFIASSNQLSGEIPSSLSNLSDLVVLYLDNNQLSGEIPSSLGDLSSLAILNINNNLLSGEIPNSVGDLSSLVILNINNNLLSGEVPDSLGSLSSLASLNLSNNKFTSMSPLIYDFVTSLPRHNFQNQKDTNTLTTAGIVNASYEFDGLPAYEQFPNYGITFEYNLTLPDGTTSIITPSIDNGKIRIVGSDLPQVGDYTLVASGTSTNIKFTDMEYTTNFSIDEDYIEYISANANGEKGSVTSKTITVDLSKELAAGELTIDDISLIASSKALTTITKDSITSLGNGKYELAVSGTWDEGTVINVVLTRTGVVFTPDTHTITLHTKYKIENNSNRNSNKEGKSNNPKTGDTNSSIILLYLTGLLVSGAYLITRRKEQR